MTKVIKRNGLLAAAIVFVVLLVLLTTAPKAHATDIYFHMGDTLHGSSATDLEVIENSEIWFTMDEVCEADDRLMTQFLAGKFEFVRRFDTMDYTLVDMEPDANGIYRWKIPRELKGKKVKFYFYCTPYYFISDEYRVEDTYDVGEDIIDLRNGTASPKGTVSGPGNTYDEAEVVRHTLTAASETDGLFDKLNWVPLSDYDITGHSYAEVDLDRSGNPDIHIERSSDGIEYMDITVLPTCDIKGDFTIRLAQDTSIKCSFVNRPHYSTLTFKFKPVTVTVPQGKTLTYTGATQTGVAADAAYYTVSGNTGKNAGSYTATLKLKDKTKCAWSDGTTADKKVTWKIKKAANPLSLTAKTATVKYSKLKKKNQTLKVTKVIKFKQQADDKKTYTLSSAKKGSKSYKKYFSIDKSSGKVTVKKGLKKGSYKIKVKVKGAGNTNYEKSATKPVTFTVKVK